MSEGSTETELRFTAPKRALTRLFAARAFDGIAVSQAATRRLLSVYWDTPALDFRRAGVVVRLRRAREGGWIQAIKASHGGPFTLHEWEAPVRGERPQLDLAHAAGWRDEAALASFEPSLQPVFATHILRTTRTATFDDGTMLELAVDRGRVDAGPRSAPIAVVEIERLHGDVRRLYELAFALVGEIRGLALTFASKADAGYALLTGDASPPRRAQRVVVPFGASGASIAICAAEEAIAQVHGNVEGARAGVDPEFLHQLRVGIRRLRASSTLARAARLPMFAPPLIASMRTTWRVLGRVRDLDVFAQDTWPAVAARVPADLRDRVDAAIAAEIDAAREALRAHLASAPLQQMLLAVAWVLAQQREQARANDAGEDATTLARRVLDRRWARVAKAGRHLETLDKSRLHRLRIAAKKLRYAAEPCAGLFAASRTERDLRRLSALQDVLGAINDEEAARRLAHALAGRVGGIDAASLDRALAERRDERREPRRRALARAWQQIERSRPFWRAR